MRQPTHARQRTPSIMPMRGYLSQGMTLTAAVEAADALRAFQLACRLSRYAPPRVAVGLGRVNDAGMVEVAPPRAGQPAWMRVQESILLFDGFPPPPATLRQGHSTLHVNHHDISTTMKVMPPFEVSNGLTVNPL